MSQETKSFTRLVEKNHSPLVIRKYTKWGWPMYVGMITDDDLSTLDDVVVAFMEANKDEGWVNNIQQVRNLSGKLSDELVAKFEKTEGCAVVLYLDKCFVSSLWGDFMVHIGCRIELYGLLTMSIGV